jgi:hypothetical protein
MNWKDLLSFMYDGWDLEVKTSPSGLTEYRTLVKGKERKKGIPQSVKAQCVANGLIRCDNYADNSQIWRIATPGMAYISVMRMKFR